MFASTGCAGNADNNQGNRTGQKISERVNRGSNGGWFWDTNDDSITDDDNTGDTGDSYNRSYNSGSFGNGSSAFGNGWGGAYITPSPGIRSGNGRSNRTTNPYTNTRPYVTGNPIASSFPDYRSGITSAPGSVYGGSITSAPGSIYGGNATTPGR
jgi:hypothetical protein